MTSSASSAAWLPAAIARAAVVHPASRTVPGGRHRAPEVTGAPFRIAMPDDLKRPGRHAAPEDAVVEREEDFLDRLGFRPAY
ncbi:hypothetical protein [Blastococcus sp. TF02A-30]|uniref:hypothetical protein n=1 Tax=Blastococcus sp. TF02A-30 TaxID=2250580 RepID=UPI000DEBBC31|nr:hypothetical protein [Blastococcus sp. TF02A-30]RBY89280.1 hypothetical protein DQ241_07280 [Blastococcus sp. TF02A-30]